MSYRAQHGMSWQGIGYGKQWYALQGMGDALTDATQKWIDEIAAYIKVQRISGKDDKEIASYLQTPSAAKQFGYLGNTLPSDWVAAAFAKSPVGIVSSTTTMGTWRRVLPRLAIGAAVVVGAYLLLRRKR